MVCQFEAVRTCWMRAAGSDDGWRLRAAWRRSGLRCRMVCDVGHRYKRLKSQPRVCNGRQNSFQQHSGRVNSGSSSKKW